MTLPDTVIRQVDRLNIDSVYMLLHPGWEHESRANRWHFAKRWAKYRKVVIVLPDLPWSGRMVRQETRLPNCRVLKVATNRGAQWRATALVQIEQLLEDMAAEGHTAPLLWLYNANFSEAFAALPAAARVHHITENYFDFPAMSPDYLDRVIAITRLADLNIAVSEGCAVPLRNVAGDRRLVVITNGCDYTEYGGDGTTDAEALALRRGFSRLAVFGGNINGRLDFDLIERTAATCPDTLLLFVGPIEPSIAVASRFGNLRRRHNVKSLGAVNPDRLPGIYRTADLGFIPYTHDRLLVENGFPLKALEMAATGLPVISSFMRPLVQYSPPLSVAADDATFLSAFAKARRNSQSDAALRTLAAANDYDVKFSSIISNLNGVPRTHGPYRDTMPSKLAAHASIDLIPALKTYLRSPRGRLAEFWFRGDVLGRRFLQTMPSPLVNLLRRIKWFLHNETRDR